MASRGQHGERRRLGRLRLGTGWLVERDPTSGRRKWKWAAISLVAGAFLIGVAFLGAYLLGKLAERRSPAEVWAVVQVEAARHGLDPGFVYAVCHAESSLRPLADSGYARGMMQMSEGAWESVTARPYHDAWDWRVNIEMGTAYLALNRRRLEQHGQFSYPLLAASYRYGFYRVKSRGFDLRRLDPPINRIYKKLFAGEIAPVKPPRGGELAGTG